MPGPTLGTLNVLTHLILKKKSCEVARIIIIFIL